MKKGPLSKVEKSYIENNARSEVYDLAKELDRSKSIVEKHLQKIKEDEGAKRGTVDSSSLYARDSNKISTVMTEAASAAADESRKKPSTPQKYKGAIHRIKEN